MVGFTIGAGAPEPLVAAPSLRFVYVDPVLVSVVVGGPEPPSLLAVAAAYSADVCMEVCLVAVTVLVVVSRVVEMAPWVPDAGVVTAAVDPGCGTTAFAAGVEVVAGSSGIGVMLISQSSHCLTTLPDSLQ